jgi:hypothetical protein
MNKWIKPIITTAVLLAVVAIMGAVGTAYLSKRIRVAAEETLPALSHLAVANQCRGQAFLHLLYALNANDDAEFHQHSEMTRRYSERSQEQLDLYSAYIPTDKHRKIFDDLMTERDNYIKTRELILSEAETGNRDAAMNKLLAQLLPMYERYLDNGQKLAEYSSQHGAGRVDAIATSSRWIKWIAVISSILIFLFGFFLGFTR